MVDEAGVSFVVMRAPWSLGGDELRRGTRPAAQLLLPLSYAPVGWRRNAAIRAGGLAVREFVGSACKFHNGVSDEQRALAG